MRQVSQPLNPIEDLAAVQQSSLGQIGRQSKALGRRIGRLRSLHRKNQPAGLEIQIQIQPTRTGQNPQSRALGAVEAARASQFQFEPPAVKAEGGGPEEVFAAAGELRCVPSQGAGSHFSHRAISADRVGGHHGQDTPELQPLRQPVLPMESLEKIQQNEIQVLVQGFHGADALLVEPQS
jgi:hypothetical protein